MGPNQTESVDPRLEKALCQRIEEEDWKFLPLKESGKIHTDSRSVPLASKRVPWRADGVRETRTLGVTADTLPVIPTEMTEKEKERRKRCSLQMTWSHTVSFTLTSDANASVTSATYLGIIKNAADITKCMQQSDWLLGSASNTTTSVTWRLI